MSTRTSDVLVSRYSRYNIQKLLSHGKIGKVHYLLKNWNEYPNTAPLVRVELAVRERNDIRANERLANLYELVCYSIKNPEIVLRCKSLEGYDEQLDRIGREIETLWTIPCCQFSGNKIDVSLLKKNTFQSSWHLVAIPYL